MLASLWILLKWLDLPISRKALKDSVGSSSGKEAPCLIPNKSGMSESTSTTRVSINGQDLNHNENLDNSYLLRYPLNMNYSGLLGSQHGSDFLALETSDYQWCNDYCYSSSRPQGVLSASSQGLHHSVTNYETLARKLDANLAEIDIEEFKTEDIHSILSLPIMCCGDFQSNHRNEMFASVSGSLMAKFDLDSSTSPKTSSMEEESVSTDLSICRSEPLFSPLKEPVAPQPGTYSVDSLDASFKESEIILTCKANKNNYTIAFEESFTQESQNSHYSKSGKDAKLYKKVLCDPGISMTHSAYAYVTWSKLKENKDSGKSNIPENECTKSYSMPNLIHKSTTSVTSEINYLNKPMKIYDVSSSGSNVSLVKLFMQHKLGSEDGGLSMKSGSTRGSYEWQTDSRSDLGSNESSGVATHKFIDNKLTSDAKCKSKLKSGKQKWPIFEENASLCGTNYGRHSHPCASRHNPMVSQSIQTSDVLRVSKSANTSPVKLKPFSSSRSSKQKAVYVCYPNYSLPDLSFLNLGQKKFDGNLYLFPQKFKPPDRSEMLIDKRKSMGRSGKRPYSCDDVIRRSSLSHIKDWESLNFLLPPEVRQMLSVAKPKDEKVRKDRHHPPRPHSCDCLDFNKGEFSDSSSSIAQKSSGYKGSSTLLTDSNPFSPIPNAPVSIFEYETLNSESENSKPPPVPKRSISLPVEHDIKCWISPAHPPLPKSILRKEQLNASSAYKRNSLIDVRKNYLRKDRTSHRRSLQEPCQAIFEDDMKQPINSYKGPRSRSVDNKDNCVQDDVDSEIPYIFGAVKQRHLSQRQKLWEKDISLENLHETVDFDEDLLSRSQSTPNLSVCDCEGELTHSKLRCQVSHFLSSKSNLEKISPVKSEDWSNDCTCDIGINKKSVSFAEKVSIHAKRESGFGVCANYCKIHTKAHHTMPSPTHEAKLILLSQKRELVCHIKAAVGLILNYFEKGLKCEGKPIQDEDSLSSSVGFVVLEQLCPALYGLLSDGLCPTIENLFGTVHNSVWRVIEATSQLGPSTKALADLVLRLNSEEHLMEGPMKFNAFIFGILNIQSLPAWLGYLRTRESVIQKHYSPEALLYLASTSARSLYDEVICCMQPLTSLHFDLDILFEYRQLHHSLMLMEEKSVRHSCGDSWEGSSRSQNMRGLNLMRAIPVDKGYEEEHWKGVNTPLGRVARLRKAFSDEQSNQKSATVCSRASNGSPVRVNKRSEGRPRSCVENSSPNYSISDLASSVKKRWSGLQIGVGSKLMQALDRLIVEDRKGVASDYTDSLEVGKGSHFTQISLDTDTDKTSAEIQSSWEDDGEEKVEGDDTLKKHQIKTIQEHKPVEGVKFRNLQRKWEILSGNRPIGIKPPSPVRSRSRIPRPVSSPTKPVKSFDKPSPKQELPPSSLPPHPDKKGTSPNKRGSVKGRNTSQKSRDSEPVLSPMDTSSSSNRSSLSSKISSNSASGVKRVHSRVLSDKTPIPRAGSLQEKTWRQVAVQHSPAAEPTNMNAKERRSVSAGRRDTRKLGHNLNDDNANRQKSDFQEKKLRTLYHHLATDNGHLSFNAGQELTLLIEVDERWLLCRLGQQKGLVPRTAVISIES